MHGALAMARKSKPVTVGRIKHVVREAEKKSGTGATGQTVLKMLAKPIARLIEDKKIGPVEMMAAQDITTAVMAVTGALWLRAIDLERRDPAHSVGYESAREIDAQRRYRNYADHWSMLAKRGDKTLQIVFAAVIDERPFHIIEADLNIRHGTARKALIRGLRDYAARAGWVDHGTAAQWKYEAGMTFRTVHPSLSLAMAAGRRIQKGSTRK